MFEASNLIIRNKDPRKITQVSNARNEFNSIPSQIQLCEGIEALKITNLHAVMSMVRFVIPAKLH